MAAIENVRIESIRADYLKKRITISLSVSILELEAETRSQLVLLAENEKLISLDFDAMPEPQGNLGL